VSATLFANCTANHGPGVMMNYLTSALAKSVGVRKESPTTVSGLEERNGDDNGSFVAHRGDNFFPHRGGKFIAHGGGKFVAHGGGKHGNKNAARALAQQQQQQHHHPVGITTYTHPFPFTSGFTNLIDEVKAISIAVNLIVSFAFVAPSIIVVLVKEREVGAKHQQMLGGASMFAYWISSYIWDFGVYMITFTVSMTLIRVSPTIDALHGDNFFAVCLLLLGYGVAMIPFTYCLSFAFKSHSTAQNVVLLLNFIAGLVLMITSFVMGLIIYTRRADEILKYVWRLFPGFCLGNGLLNIALLGVKTSLGLPMPNPSPFAWEIVGEDVCVMGVEAVVYFVLCLLLEAYPHVVQKMRRDKDVLDGANDDDEDVLAERNRVTGAFAGIFGRRGGGEY
jgi:hypothetical protein